MHCVMQTCRQGRDKCSSPLACGADPRGVASYFEELDRQSKAHHAAMNKKLGGGNYYPQAHLRGPRRVERIGLRVLLALVIFLALMFGPYLWRLM